MKDSSMPNEFSSVEDHMAFTNVGQYITLWPRDDAETIAAASVIERTGEFKEVSSPKEALIQFNFVRIKPPQ